MEKFDKIEQYLSGELSPEETRQFEAEVSEDTVLREELELHRLAREAIELEIEENLRSILKSWPEEKKETAGLPGSKVRRLRPRIFINLAIAASFLLLLSAGTIWWANNNFGRSQLAGMYFDSNALSTVRSGTADQALEDGLQALREGKYEEAETFFSAIPLESDHFLQARYLLGLSHYRAGNTSEVTASLSTVLQGDDENLKDKAEWLLILNALKTDQINEPANQELLQKIANNPDHSFSRQAEELSKKINGFWYRVVN